MLAKTTRDAMMAERHRAFPQYGWAGNKGYSAPDHLQALAEHGSCEQHRRSWRLPGLAVPAPRVVEASAEALDLGLWRTRRSRTSPPTPRGVGRHDGPVSAEDLENYETEMELQLYREYRDVVSLFSYVVETERRFYLANSVDLQVRTADGETYFEVTLHDAWVWDVYRPARFVRDVRVVTFKDVNVEELQKRDIEVPDGPDLRER